MLRGFLSLQKPWSFLCVQGAGQILWNLAAGGGPALRLVPPCAAALVPCQDPAYLQRSIIILGPGCSCSHTLCMGTLLSLSKQVMECCLSFFILADVLM